jgi:hypothetical protein
MATDKKTKKREAKQSERMANRRKIKQKRKRTRVSRFEIVISNEGKTFGFARIVNHNLQTEKNETHCTSKKKRKRKEQNLGGDDGTECAEGIINSLKKEKEEGEIE